MATAVSRLPGLRFETARPPAAPGLPRMDVAAFVGFAAAGPVGVPVAVDDEVRFREVFGGELPLAWDAARGETVYAHLAPAVREFLRNGGRRCWIVRVGDEAALEAAVFRLPGVLRAGPDGVDAGHLVAASPGSWADGTSLNATVMQARVARSGYAVEEGGIRLSVERPDLLRLTFDDGTVAFLPPRADVPAADETPAERRARAVRPVADGAWYRALSVSRLHPGAGPAFLAGPREVPLGAVTSWKVRSTDGDPRLEIALGPGAVPQLQAGCWIRAGWALGGFAALGGVFPFTGDGKGPHLTPEQRKALDEAPPPPLSEPSDEIPALWELAVPSDVEPSQVDEPLVLGEAAPSGVEPSQVAPPTLLVGEMPSSHVDEPLVLGEPTPSDVEPSQVDEPPVLAIGDAPAPVGELEEAPGGGDDGGSGKGPDDQPDDSGDSDGPDDSGDPDDSDDSDDSGGPDDSDQPDEAGEGERSGGGGNREFGGAHAYDGVAYLLVDEVIRGEAETTILIRQAWRTLNPDYAWQEVGGQPFEAALLSIELWSRSGDGSVARLPGVGLVPRHPRFLGTFPADTVRFASTETLTQSAAPPTADELAMRAMRFAAPDVNAYLVDADGVVRLVPRGSRVESPASTGFYLPLGVPTLPRDDFAQAAQTSDATALERDGAASFSASVFLDPILDRESAETLLDTAFHYAYVAEPALPPARMHALLRIEEISILSVPDSVHPGWILKPGEAPPPTPDAPSLIQPIPQPDADGLIAVQWTAVPDALGYTLEDSADPRFRGGVRSTETTADEVDPGTSVEVAHPDPCPARLYFRVRARTAAGPSAWSATALLATPDDAFRVCGEVPLAAPSLSVFVPPRGERLSISWRPAIESPELEDARRAYDRVFRVESSPEPTFALPEAVYEGTGRSTEIWKPLSGTLYLRVASWLRERAESSRTVEESPWSPAHAVGTTPEPRWETRLPSSANSAAADVHRAMLRFCAARSDCFAVLTLPRHQRDGDALAHASALATSLGGGSGEPGDTAARTLSFGALYHPWTLVRTPVAAAPLRAIPSDGAIAGIIATRANTLGPWAAPANLPLAGVAALDPKLPESARSAFWDNRVNGIALFPAGFQTWSEETLSDDPELRGIGVRRLLILLRRIALREGNAWVFEPNGPAFRRLVQRQFDGILGDLYVRGAFAGRQHADGYRVVTDETVNPREAAENGRFTVELRVAPSRPLAFLTVRLVQTGAGVTVQEG